MPRDQSCETLTILMARSHADLEVYCEAVARLSHRDGTPFDELYALSERARRALEDSREKLKDHIREHGCVA